MLALAKNQRLHQRYVYLDTFSRIHILVARDSLCVTCVDCQSLVLDGCVRDNCILVSTVHTGYADTIRSRRRIKSVI